MYLKEYYYIRTYAQATEERTTLALASPFGRRHEEHVRVASPLGKRKESLKGILRKSYIL